MARSYDMTCPYCGCKFHVLEFPMGVPGGKEKENIDCPWCNHTVEQKMTDGWFVTSKIEI